MYSIRVNTRFLVSLTIVVKTQSGLLYSVMEEIRPGSFLVVYFVPDVGCYTMLVYTFFGSLYYSRFCACLTRFLYSYMEDTETMSVLSVY